MNFFSRIGEMENTFKGIEIKNQEIDKLKWDLNEAHSKVGNYSFFESIDFFSKKIRMQFLCVFSVEPNARSNQSARKGHLAH